MSKLKPEKLILKLRGAVKDDTKQEEKEPSRNDSLVFIGTYTQGVDTPGEGIHVFHLNSETGELTSAGQPVNAGINPSYVGAHPTRNLVYCVNENDGATGGSPENPTGEVLSFSYSNEGQLTRINSELCKGRDPCYSKPDPSGRFIGVANYTSGDVSVMPILSATGAVLPVTDVQQHDGTFPGPVPCRQEGPHAHSALFDGNTRFMYACDLGADRIFVYSFDAESGRLTPTSITPATPGDGPRHITLHPTGQFAYVTNELSNTISAYRVNPLNGELSLTQRVSSLPPDYEGIAYIADVHLSQNGNVLYASNREQNSIVIFNVDGETGTLRLQGFQSTGDWPRTFAIDPTGRVMVVAHQNGNSVVTFIVDSETGNLTPSGYEVKVGTPTGVAVKRLSD